MVLLVIDHKGDVIINTSEATSLLVSSKILSLASPVFAAMFSPRFREGMSLSTDAPVTIDLSDDDSPAALETIFNIVHFRHQYVDANLSASRLLEIAIVADKYDIARSLGPWRERWAESLLSLVDRPTDPGGCHRLVFIMWVFEYKTGFHYYTGIAAIIGKGPKEEEEGGMFEELPDRIREAIAAARIATIEKILNIAESIRLYYQSPGKKCHRYRRDCDATILCSLVNYYADMGIYPLPQPPYNDFSVVSLGLRLRSLTEMVQGHQQCLSLEFRDTLRELEMVLEHNQGLSLEAFR